MDNTYLQIGLGYCPRLYFCFSYYSVISKARNIIALSCRRWLTISFTLHLPALGTGAETGFRRGYHKVIYGVAARAIPGLRSKCCRNSGIPARRHGFSLCAARLCVLERNFKPPRLYMKVHERIDQRYRDEYASISAAAERRRLYSGPHFDPGIIPDRSKRTRL